MGLRYKTLIVFLMAGIILLLLIFLLKAEWLTIDIGLNLPVGTLVSWLLIVAFAVVMLLLFTRNPGDRVKLFLALALKINLALAAVWGFVSFLLSGNWSFNFGSGIWFTVWIYYTSVIFVLPLVVLLSWATILLIRKIFNPK